MKPTRCLVFSILATAPLAVAVFATAQTSQTSHEPVPSAPAQTAIAPEFEPISYFADKCARCHGPGGAYYDLKHLAQASDEKLHAVIAAMAEGPGQAPLDARGVAMQSALHRSMIDGKPFVSLAALAREGQGKNVRGEVTPDSTVTLVSGKNSIAATVDDFRWQATLPADFDESGAVILAVQGERRTELPMKQSYSHQK